VTRTAAPFPWADAMAVGFGQLRLGPDSFWRMTPRELGAAIEGLYGRRAGALGGDALQALMQRFPDQPANERGNDDDTGR
jgi:uncharacterized phage protein (TIGR02216 family)